MSDNERLAKLEMRVENHEKDLCSVTADIREIKDKLLQRPSWAVMIIMTALISFISILLTYILKH